MLRSFQNSAAVRLAAAGLIVSSGIFIGKTYMGGHASGRVYRIGWEADPPFQQKGSDGQPSGFAVELVREAARRRGIQLEWVERPSSSEDSLRRGLVDLWPLMTILPERKKLVHISNPYMQHDHYLLVRAGSPFRQPQDLSRATVAVEKMPVAQRLARRLLPDATLSPKISAAAAVESVCDGSADGTVLDEFVALSSLLGGTRCTEPMRAIWAPEISVRLGVGSTFAAAGVADDIRDEIRAMGRDNRLTQLMTKWNYYSPRNLQVMNDLLNADRTESRLIAT